MNQNYEKDLVQFKNCSKKTSSFKFGLVWLWFTLVYLNTPNSNQNTRYYHLDTRNRREHKVFMFKNFEGEWVDDPSIFKDMVVNIYQKKRKEKKRSLP